MMGNSNKRKEGKRELFLIFNDDLFVLTIAYIYIFSISIIDGMVEFLYKR